MKKILDRTVDDIDRVPKSHLTSVATVTIVTILVLRFGDLSRSTVYLLDLWLLWTAAGIAYQWVYIFAGRFSFMQTYLMLFGGYVSVRVNDVLGFSDSSLALIGAMIAAGVVGGAVEFLARKSEHFVFAIMTFAAAQLGMYVLDETSILSGAHGAVSGIGALRLGPLEFKSDMDIAYLLSVIVAILLLVSSLLRFSPVYRHSLASRVNSKLAFGLGVNADVSRRSLFVLGSAVCGLLGAIYGHWQGVITPDGFGLDAAIGLLLIVELGGSRSVWGPLVGAAVFIFLPDLLESYETWQGIIYGLLLLAIVLLLPGGITSFFERFDLRDRLRRTRAIVLAEGGGDDELVQQ